MQNSILDFLTTTVIPAQAGIPYFNEITRFNRKINTSKRGLAALLLRGPAQAGMTVKVRNARFKI